MVDLFSTDKYSIIVDNDLYMTMLPLKASHKKQRSVTHFLFTKGLSINAIHTEIDPIYRNKCFTRPAIHVSLGNKMQQKKWTAKIS